MCHKEYKQLYTVHKRNFQILLVLSLFLCCLASNRKIQAEQTTVQLIGQVKKEPLVTSGEGKYIMYIHCSNLIRKFYHVRST